MKQTIRWLLIIVCLLCIVAVEAAEPNTTLTIKQVGRGIDISWRAVEGCSEYILYRSPSRFGKYEAVTSLTQTNFRDSAPKYSYYKVGTRTTNGGIALSEPHSLEIEIFGNNTLIISPEDSPQQVIKAIEEITDVLSDGKVSQFSHRREAILFKAGNYDWLGFENGFYMHVAGLGFSPEDTRIDRVSVNTNWLGGNNATCNFWRTLENVTLLNSRGSFNYGVSQAAPLRRLKIHGKVALDMGGWSSGGYLADSRVEGSVGSGSQQQFFLRNNSLNHFWGVNWNLVSVGNRGTIDSGEINPFKRTIIEKTPVVYEKPFLFFEDGDYRVFIPSARENVSGVSWEQQRDKQGKSVGLSHFYVAHAYRDNDITINRQLKQGKHILFTPGIYLTENPIVVDRPGAVLLGLGLASICPTHGKSAMEVADVEGVRVAGLIFDAGSGVNCASHTGGSPILLQVGKRGAKKDLSKNPIVLSDLFFRVGGVKTELPCRADISLEINANFTIGDHFWIWRADHGDQVGWELNRADYGLVVNGDEVTIYGLFVEHYQKYDTYFKGDNGRVYFYQNEKAYDVPYQKDWMSPDGKGWAAYRVADGVKRHRAWGVGVYSVFIHTKEFVVLEDAIRTPLTGEIEIYYPFTMLLSTNGGIEHIINGIGGPNTNRDSKRGSSALLPQKYNNEWKSEK